MNRNLVNKIAFDKKQKINHKKGMQQRSRDWGKVKFKPQPVDFTPEVEEAAQPWREVKNDIIDDEREQRNANNADMDSVQAQEFRKQREKDYRRDLIETNRKEPTQWENFNDDEDKNSRGKGKGKKPNYQQRTHDKTSRDTWVGKKQEQLTNGERNHIRKRLTKGICMTKGSGLVAAISDMKHRGVLRAERGNKAQAGNKHNKSA